MIEKFQKQLQLGSWLIIAVLALSIAWLGQSIGKLSEEGNVSDTITVAGTGKVTATPDVAVADLAITVQGTTAKAAQDDASKKSTTAVDYLKNAGVDDKDIKTLSYNIYPQYDYTNGRNTIRGYQVTETIEVKIRNLDKANDILAGVVGAGVNQVNNFRFDIDNPDQLKSDARAKAIADANTKANELKHQLGVHLGKIVSFSETSDGVVPPIYAKSMSGMGMGGGGPVPDIPTGENEITVNVSITYQIN